MQGRLSNTPETVHFDGMVLDVAGHSLVDAAGRDVGLTHGEFALLVALARRPDHVLSREQLLDAVSGRNAAAFDRSVDNLIARLRRKIECDVKRPRIIVTVRGAGYKFCSSRVSSVRASARSGILALPLAAVGNGRDVSHCAAALSDTLRTELKNVIGARVQYHNERANAHEVAGRLGLAYVVRGSLRQDDDKMRVDFQMTDAATGDPVWVDRFEGVLLDISGFEYEVMARILRGIDLEFAEIERRRGLGRPDTLDADDLLKLGFAFLYRPRSPQNLARARGFLERALDLDCRCAEALAGLAQTHISDTLCRWSHDPASQVRLADEQVTRSIEINPRLGYAHHVKGLVLRVKQQPKTALAAFDKAVQLSPSLAPAHAERCFTRHLLDRGASRFARMHEGLALARRISPRESVLANWLYGVGIGHLKFGEITEAIGWLNESIAVNPLPPALAYLASAYALLGDDVHARSALRDFTRCRPHETLTTFGRRLLADHQILPGSRVFEGLRKAGLREA
ncbi:winged helix-turn-helix domain-containing protein [Bradyrhizobium sp.]|uniref:winged helix-turn-helix domain-containing protein n=1 Tax=Bradyrhizobium sp. TaxID=376 RepID=UPI002616AE0A|nr:winged helix-turn-helix domain-containing protein [Bradyrhizobium sp.]